MLLLIFGTLLAQLADAVLDIKADCGRLAVQGFNSCELHHHDDLITLKGPGKQNLTKPRFGLITYKCDHEAGFLMSNADCERCNLQCTEEDFAQGSTCQNNETQLWSGFILGIIVSAVIGALILKRLWRALDVLRKDSGNTRRSSIATIYKDEEVFLQEGGGDNEDRTGDGLRDREDEKNANQKGRRRTTPNKTILSVITGLLLSRSAQTCQVMFFTDAVNGTEFCQNSVYNPASFSMLKGHEICVEDHVGGVVKLQVSGIITRSRYELAYYTSDYTVEVATEASECSYSESCFVTSDNDCVWRAMADLSKKGKNMTNSQCLDDFQFGISCAYSEQAHRTGGLFSVLRKTAEVKMVVLTVKELNSSRTVVLSSYDRTYSLNFTGLRKATGTGDSLQVTMLDSSTSNMSLSNTLMFNGSEFFYVNSTEVNETRSGSFGDFQVSLDKRVEMHAESTVSCKILNLISDQCICTVDGDSIIRGTFLNKQGDFKQPSGFITRNTNYSIVETFEPLETGEVVVKFGPSSPSPDQMNGSCDVKLIGSYGCTSCDESPYVVFAATKIKTPGLVPFYSHCSFNQKYIKCDYEPTKLVLKDLPASCYVQLPTNDQRFTFNMKYFKFGGGANFTESHSCTHTATNYIFSYAFIGSFALTVFLSVISFLIALLVFGYINKGRLYAVLREIETQQNC